MSLFFFGTVTSKTSQKLLSQIETICGQNVEIFQTITGFTKRLRQIGTIPELFVFAPATDSKLSELIDHKDLFDSYPIILVLPNRRDSTIHKGHLLTPNFLTFWDSDLTEVSDVLTKMQKANSFQPERDGSEKKPSALV